VEGAVRNWFEEDEGGDGKRRMGRAWRPSLKKEEDEEEEERRVTAMVERVVKRQAELGVDIVTDGEVGREGYYMHFLRHGVQGIDVTHLSDKVMRDGAFVSQVPTVNGPVSGPPEPWCYKEYLRAQSASPVPVKYTLPGPMTLMDGSFNRHYSENPSGLRAALVQLLQREVLALAAHGCRHIQLDEPVMMRYPEDALEYGVKNAALVFAGCPDSVERTVHLCCGYPDRLEPTDYKKADSKRYPEVLCALDVAGFHWASIEGAESGLDLSFVSSLHVLGLQLGVVKVARSRVESVEEVVALGRAAIKNGLPPHRLMLAPDCGLGFLPLQVAEAKLANMVEAAKQLSSSS